MKIRNRTWVILMFVLVTIIALLISCAPPDSYVYERVQSVQVFTDSANNIVCYYIDSSYGVALQCMNK